MHEELEYFEALAPNELPAPNNMFMFNLPPGDQLGQELCFTDDRALDQTGTPPQGGHCVISKVESRTETPGVVWSEARSLASLRCPIDPIPCPYLSDI
eukprot:980568-Prorocentrum_minimum.AAC.2